MMQVYWSNKASSPAASFDGGRLCCFPAAAGRVIRVVGSTKLPRYMKSALTALVWMELTGRGEVGAGAAVVGGGGLVSDEEAVPDGDALPGEDSGERGDAAGVGVGLSGVGWFRWCRRRR